MIVRFAFVAGMALLVLLVAGCDDGGMKPAGGGGTATGGPVTGLLLVAQTVEGGTVDMAHKTVTTWNVVDQSGSRLFGNSRNGFSVKAIPTPSPFPVRAPGNPWPP